MSAATESDLQWARNLAARTRTTTTNIINKINRTLVTSYKLKIFNICLLFLAFPELVLPNIYCWLYVRYLPYAARWISPLKSEEIRRSYAAQMFWGGLVYVFLFNPVISHISQRPTRPWKQFTTCTNSLTAAVENKSFATDWNDEKRIKRNIWSKCKKKGKS